MRTCGRCGCKRSERDYRTYRHIVGGRLYVNIQSWCVDCERSYARAYYYTRKQEGSDAKEKESPAG